MNFLFWNIKRKDSFFNTIIDIVVEEDIDVIAFAEFPDGQQTVFKDLLVHNGIPFHYLSPIRTNKVELFYKAGKVNISRAYDGERISVSKIQSQVDHNDYLLVFCHLSSKLYSDKEQQSHLCRYIVNEITTYESSVNNFRTLVCGDFNMDPFDSGMKLCDGFNAMMTASLASKIIRKVCNKEYKLFYNPMWGLYGDLHGGDVPGTYIYASTEPIHQYWHMLDQVIMRPDVIPVFDKRQLRIVTKGHRYNLLNRNNNISNHYSDHLPIKFTLNI